MNRRKMTENIEYYRNQVALARTEIKNLRQQLSNLKHEHLKEIKLIKSTLAGLSCSSCGDSATTISSYHTEPSISDRNDGVCFRPIGVIDTSFQNKRGVPRQPSVMAKAQGTVVIDTSVFNNPEHALCGLEQFSHMWIIFHFHNTESNSVPAKVAPPRLGGERQGVFATRSPHRPCPIGLSLVKIDSIEGNKIHFLGVDMINNTPVLDIKPYIPQYDYPGLGIIENVKLTRPPTEGVSDGVVSLQIDVDDANQRNPIGVSTSPLLSPQDVPSPQLSNLLTPVSPSPDSPSSIEGTFSPTQRDTERGAPDGQERFTPPQSHLTNLTQDGIRIAPWISNPPTQSYQVNFTEDAFNRLTELIGDRAQMFKANIECLLTEDPRSQYVRSRYPDHEYSCVLEDVSISCVFDAASSTCTIITVRSAEDMQT